jgi:hypothetical protein
LKVEAKLFSHVRSLPLVRSLEFYDQTPITKDHHWELVGLVNSLRLEFGIAYIPDPEGPRYLSLEPLLTGAHQSRQSSRVPLK